MPYGFEEYMKKEGYREETIDSYIKVANQFFAFLNNRFGGKDLREIYSNHIKAYLKDQIDHNKSISTINKELTIIKTLFDYFYQTDKINFDPAVKIQTLKKQIRDSDELQELSNHSDLLYIYNLDSLEILKDRVINNTDYSSVRKLIFLLASKGLRTSEFRIKKSNIIIEDGENVVLDLVYKKMKLEDNEAATFLEYYNTSLFIESDYLFVTKKSKSNNDSVNSKARTGVLVPIEVMSILNHLRAISADYLPDIPALTLVNIRRSIIYDFYYNKHKSIQEISNYLGI